MKSFCKRWLSLALVFIMFLSTLTPVLAAYEVPVAGDQAWISVSTRLKRSDNGNVYYLYSSGSHELRYFHFREAGYGGTKNYDPNTVMYCVEMGVDLPDNPKYTAGYAANHSFWTNLSNTAKAGMLLAIGFGYPHSSLSELCVPSRDDAIAATQTIVWEFYRGYRTSFEGMPSNTYLYDGYIKNTPAYNAYWNILAKANNYYKDSRFDLGALTNNDRFIVWTRSNAQTMMSFTIPNDANLAGPPQFKPTGRIEIYKTDPSGNPLSGAGFTAVHQSTGNLYEIGPTNGNGYTISEYLPFGTYTVTETIYPSGYVPSVPGGVWTVTLDQNAPNGTLTLNIVNTPAASIKIVKRTNTGENISGWQFKVWDPNRTYLGKFTTGADGTVTIPGLSPGWYSIQEVDGPGFNSEFWLCDTTEHKVEVNIGAVTTHIVENYHRGKLQIVKQTNTGENVSGWKFEMYDPNGIYLGPFTTGADGTVTVPGLAPGEYTVREIDGPFFNDEYWDCDTETHTITITAGAVTTHIVSNKYSGKICIQKETNTGDNLEGWQFMLKDEGGNEVGTYTTADDGTVTTENLLPGTYYLTEQSVNDDYWECDNEEKIVNVVAGQTTLVTVKNKHLGKVDIQKETNTNKSLEDWEFSVFSDEDCTDLITTVISDETGKAEAFIAPGVYWVKETDGPGYNNEYWTCDAEPQRIEVKAGEDTTISFTNTHYGKLQIQKELATDGPLEGWKYQITRLSDNAVMGILTSEDSGTVLSEKLLPGDYLIEEIFEENSLFYCKTENPLTVTVKAGETAAVSFTNALRPGKIEIEKINFSGEHLAGAKFLLEWSEDGQTWQPVTFSDKEDVVKGTCGSEALADGALITDETGVISFENLYPLVQYRVTELEAPEGYVLLSDYAYLGELPTDSLTVSLVVHNGHGYVLPATGIDNPGFLSGFGTTLAVLALAIAATFTFAYFKPVYNGKNAIK